MKKLLKKIFIWVYGRDPLLADKWTGFVDGEFGSSWVMLLHEHRSPPRRIVRPVIEFKEWKEDEMPEESEVSFLVLKYICYQSRIAQYKRVKDGD